MKTLAIIALLFAGAANAAVVAEAKEGPVRVELHDQVGHCQGGAMLALWHEGDAVLTGCWRVVGTIVQIAWSDGDITRASISAFTSIKGV